MKRAMLKWIIPCALAVASYGLLKDFFVPHDYVWAGFAAVWAFAVLAHAISGSVE